MKNLFRSLILCLTLGFTGCSTISRNQVALAKNKPRIVVSHSILCDLTKAIAEDTIELNCLLDAGVDPHSYRPNPSDKKAIEEAQLIFYGGYELEPTIAKLLKATKNPAPKVPLYEIAVPEPIKTEAHHGEEHQENEPGENIDRDRQAEATEKKEELKPDPHIWHDVNNVLTIVDLIQSTLIQANPNDVAIYLEKSAALNQELGQLNVWISEQIATIPEGQRILVTTHNALNYYVQAYGLESYKTLQGLSPEASPTASKLRELATEIQAVGVPTIFAEVGTSDRLINTIAREAKVTVAETALLTDGLGEAGTPSDNYIGMMVNNTCAIAEGLGGECTSFE